MKTKRLISLIENIERKDDSHSEEGDRYVLVVQNASSGQSGEI